MKNILFLLFACTTDVGIIAVDKKQEDTSIHDTVLTDTSIIDTDTSIIDTEDTNQEISGTVGLIEWELEQIACPACMGVYQEITVEFNADFHQKIADTHPYWVPEQGQCVTNINYLTISRNSLDIGNSINLRGSYNSFTAFKDSFNNYKANIYENQYDRDTRYTLQTQDGNSLQFNSIHGFDYIEPVELRYVDPSYAFAVPVSRYGSTFWWGPSGSHDLFNITLAVYSQDGSQLLGYVSCSGADSGMMTIPGQYLSNFPYWGLVAIHMTRFSKQRVPFEKLNGYVDVHLYWSVVGTGHIE